MSATAKKESPLFVGLVLGVVGAGLYFGDVAGFYGMMGGMLGMLAGGVMIVMGIVNRPK